MHIKKILLVLTVGGLISCLFVGCNITTPSGSDSVEGEDGAGSIQRVVMVELFVAPTCSRCPSAKLAINSLSNKYGLDQMVILEEYGWDDPNSVYVGWHTQETFQRFKWYNDST
ncbi:unnamed protein product, partial [marine sediment metagenome]